MIRALTGYSFGWMHHFGILLAEHLSGAVCWRGTTVEIRGRTSCMSFFDTAASQSRLVSSSFVKSCSLLGHFSLLPQHAWADHYGLGPFGVLPRRVQRLPPFHPRPIPFVLGGERRSGGEGGERGGIWSCSSYEDAAKPAAHPPPLQWGLFPLQCSRCSRWRTLRQSRLVPELPCVPSGGGGGATAGIIKCLSE